MGVLEYVILAILAASAIYGFARGIVWGILSLAIWVAGYGVAARVYGFGTEYVLRITSDPILAGGISFAAVFLVTALVIGTLVRLIHRVVRRHPPSLLSRLIAFVFGLARGVLIVSVLLLFSASFSEQTIQGDLLKGSPLAPYMDIATESISLAFSTVDHGPLDNRLTRELMAVRENRGQGVLGNLARAIERRQDPERLKESTEDLSPKEGE